MNTALQTVESDQQGDRYVTPTEILRLLEESKKAGKIFVLNSDCGTGKTQAILEAVSQSFEQGWLLVIEKIATGERMREALIKRGVPEANIEVYHHKNEQGLKEIYNRQNPPKAVSIITHKRLALDPLHYFLHSNKNYVIIDEKPALSHQDEVNSAILLSSLKELLEHPSTDTKVHSKRLPLTERLEQVFRDNSFLKAPEVKALIANYRMYLDAYIDTIINHVIDIETKRTQEFYSSDEETVTDTIRNVTGLKIPKEWKLSLEKLKLNKLRARFKARLMYKLCLNIEAILTGRITQLSSNTSMYPLLLTTVTTPLLDWEQGTLILDGSADLSRFHSYPTDCIKVVQSQAKLLPVKVRIIVVPSVVSKYDVQKGLKNSKALYTQYLHSLLDIALSECPGPIYYTGYKGRKDELEPDDTILSVTFKVSRHEDFDNIHYEDKSERRVRVSDHENSVYSTKKIKHLLSLELDIPEGQVSLLTSNSHLESLPENPRFILSYYGLMKGSNAFTAVTNFVSQGFFIFPGSVYHTMRRNKITNDMEGIAAEELYQEVMRTGIRAGKDVTLILGDDRIQIDKDNPGEYQVSRPIQLVIDKLKKNHEVNLIQKSLKDTYELAVRPGIKLIIKQFQENSPRHWKSSKDLLLQLINHYPVIIESSQASNPGTGVVEINVQEFAKKLNPPRSSDHLLKSIRKMVNNSSGYLQMEITSQARNQHDSTKIRFRINHNLIKE